VQMVGGGLVRLLNQPVLRVAAARAISFTGGEAALLAISFVIYEKTQSSWWLSATLLVTMSLQPVLGPWAGMLADRFDRRRVMIGSDLAGAACYAVLAFASEPWAIVLLAALATVAEAPFFPASAAAIPSLVADEDLEWANSAVSGGESVGAIAGPALGGVLLASVGARSTFLANAATFVLSAILIAMVRRDLRPGHSERSDHRSALAGFRFLGGRPRLAALAGAWVLLWFASMLAFTASIPFAKEVGLNGLGLGLLCSCWGAGAICGATLVALARRGTFAYWIPLAGLVAALGHGVVAFAPAVWAAYPAFFLGGAATTSGELLAQITLQRSAPNEIRGRVFAAVSSADEAAAGFAFLFFGLALPTLGSTGIYATAAGAAVLAGIAGLAAAGVQETKPVSVSGDIA
jgi:MFS family permease